MKTGFIQMLRLTKVNIAKKVSQSREIKLCMIHTNDNEKPYQCNIATRVFQSQATERCMKGYLPMRNHTNVNIATRVFQRAEARIQMKIGFIQKTPINWFKICNATKIYEHGNTMYFMLSVHGNSAFGPQFCANKIISYHITM